MVETARHLDVKDQAARAAADAAARAGVRVEELHDMPAIEDAARLFTSIWSVAPDEPPISSHLMKAMAHTGNYVSGAYADGRLIGAIVGMFGSTNGSLELHSHILGVDPLVQNRSVGFALKLHQRAWALERGIHTMTWTFDPLVRRNAYFNLTKLGAGLREYHENFYGAMDDTFNAGDESDRVLVAWHLDSDRAVEASLGRHLILNDDPNTGTSSVAALRPDASDEPVIETVEAPRLLAWIPNNIVTLRSADPDRALRWRRALREVLGPAMADGYTAEGMTRSGWLVLHRSA
ncbi:MAG TPA: GNAT family N-acetyltransferase [Actinomycetota bacterium]|nr:GNAT family N-acetyltransferase [Actinomycetota bacterium]